MHFLCPQSRRSAAYGCSMSPDESRAASAQHPAAAHLLDDHRGDGRRGHRRLRGLACRQEVGLHDGRDLAGALEPADADAVYGALTGDKDHRNALPDNPMSADRVRWEHIQRVFELCSRNVSETARRLNMHRRTLQRILGKKTLENEILKEAVEYATEKKWIARSPLLPGDGE